MALRSVCLTVLLLGPRLRFRIVEKPVRNAQQHRHDSYSDEGQLLSTVWIHPANDGVRADRSASHRLLIDEI